MNDYNESKSKLGIVVVILLILVIAGAVYYFFINKNDTPNTPVESNGTVTNNNVQKITFIKKISGTSGDLYLSKDNKAYLALTNVLSLDSIASLAQEFNVEKNEIYNDDTVKAILIVLPNVIEIGYDDTESNFVLKTQDEKVYNINDTDIRVNNKVNLLEKKRRATK